MELGEFSSVNRARCIKWMGSKDSLQHHLIGLMEEFGELCSAIKKADRPTADVGNVPLDKDSVASEIADVFIYLDLVAMHLGVDLTKAVTNKFNATSEKYGFPERL